MIPTSIDGTDITGATIDGTDVTEITVDGDTVFTAEPVPPDQTDLLHHFAARLETGLSNNSTTTTITDHKGGNDVTGDAVAFETNYQNGLPTFVFDGNDELTNASISLTQPFTIAFVAESEANNTSQIIAAGDGFDKNINMDTGAFNNKFSIQSKTAITANGADDLNFNLFITVFDGSNSLIRKNGSQIASGDAGSFDWSEFKIGGRGDSFRFQGNLPEMLVYDGVNTTDVETFLSDTYNISI